MSSLIQYYEKQKHVGFSGRGCVPGPLVPFVALCSFPPPGPCFGPKAGGRAITNIDFILTCLGYFYLRVNSGRGEIQAEKC